MCGINLNWYHNRSIAWTYMTTWYTVTATECWLGSKILELKMIVMFEGKVNIIPVIRSILRICLLSNPTDALFLISISTCVRAREKQYWGLIPSLLLQVLWISLEFPIQQVHSLGLVNEAIFVALTCVESQWELLQQLSRSRWMLRIRESESLHGQWKCYREDKPTSVCFLTHPSTSMIPLYYHQSNLDTSSFWNRS